MKFGVAILSLFGAKLKLKTAQAFKFDPQIEKWDSDWDYLENANCKGTKHLFLVSQISEEECCSPSSIKLAKNAAKRVWELSKTISSKITVTSFSDGFGGLPFYQELDNYFGNTIDYFSRPELEIFTDIDEQDPVVYERSELLSVKDSKRDVEEFIGTCLDRKLKSTRNDKEVEVYILPPKVLQYVTLKLLQLPTSSWSRYIFRKASITWLQINASGNVFAHSIDDCSYEGANRDALYEEETLL